MKIKALFDTISSMEESGVIIKDNGSTVMIRAEKSTACESCASKSACYSLSPGEVLIEADNPVGAKVGDRVVFSAGAVSVLKAGVLLYLVPVLCFIAGVVLGQTAGKALFPGASPDLLSGVFGAGFLVAAFVGLKVYGKVIEKRSSFRPQVLRVV